MEKNLKGSLIHLQFYYFTIKYLCSSKDTLKKDKETNYR